MNSYQLILEDILRILPTEVAPYVPPYGALSTMDEKFEALKESIERAKRLGNRQMQLANAFFLGRFLEKELGSNALRSYYMQKLTTHYRAAAIRTYYIFEAPGINQIMRTVNTTLTLVRRISQEEYQDLVMRSLEIFNGVEN
jgi:hypothetical protein